MKEDNPPVGHKAVTGGRVIEEEMWNACMRGVLEKDE